MEHDVTLGTQLFFAAILGGLITCLALEEKIHAKKSLIAGASSPVISLLAAAIMHLLPFGPVQVHGHDINMPVYIPAIDWGVIAIILGSSIFVDVTARSPVSSRGSPSS